MSLVNHLLASDPLAYKKATQSNFLLLAAQGQLPKHILGQWLANDRLYIHAYIKGSGNLLSFLPLPTTILYNNNNNNVTMQLLDWVIEAIVNVRREEKFFISTAARYGISVELPHDNDAGRVSDGAKSNGLLKYEGIFGSISDNENENEPEPIILPWLEAAVVFYATEKCYLDAWSWAKSQIPTTTTTTSQLDFKKDLDGGALREEFINNWSSEEFSDFVNRLGDILDVAVSEAVSLHGEDVKSTLFKRAEKKWQQVLDAEQVFWPEVKG